MALIEERARTQPAPPHAVFEALAEPNRARGRQWLTLRSDEVSPQVVEALKPRSVVWSSIWRGAPVVSIHFDIAASGGGSTVSWVLDAGSASPPNPTELSKMKQRIDQLINRDLRLSFGQ